jgi:uncharacterized protein YecE (DUF72 family)
VSDRVHERLPILDVGGVEIHVHFDNDGEGHAVRNAATLKGLVGA